MSEFDREAAEARLLALRERPEPQSDGGYGETKFEGTPQLQGIEICTGGVERIRIDNNGDFYVKGHLVTRDLLVYEAIREFLLGARPV